MTQKFPIWGLNSFYNSSLEASGSLFLFWLKYRRPSTVLTIDDTSSQKYFTAWSWNRSNMETIPKIQSLRQKMHAMSFWGGEAQIWFIKNLSWEKFVSHTWQRKQTEIMDLLFKSLRRSHRSHFLWSVHS